MSPSRKTKERVYAVLRAEEEVTNPEWHITVTKVLRSQSAAEQEVARLNQLNAEKGCRYFLQATQLVEDEAGGDGEGG